MTPTDPQVYQLLATFYWEKAFKDPRLSPAAEAALTSTRASPPPIAPSDADPDYVDALTYKNILLRMKANTEADPASRQALVAEADALRNRAMELAEGPPDRPCRHGLRAGARSAASAAAASTSAGRARRRPGAGSRRRRTSSRRPRLRDVKPVYPEEALACARPGRRHHRSDDRFAGQRQHRPCASRPAPARSGRPRRCQGVAVYADDAERRGGAGDHDGDGELHDGSGRAAGSVQGDSMSAPPPPPPPPPAELVDGQAPVRVGGNIKPPTKTQRRQADLPG